jgi:hypothetical protein
MHSAPILNESLIKYVFFNDLRTIYVDADCFLSKRRELRRLKVGWTPVWTPAILRGGKEARNPLKRMVPPARIELATIALGPHIS